ncbi:hypothetical protein H6F86_21540 [Phormidium sp. FACHB-592]|uniref:Uncharacterized protein n=1 Tax=Stenomitos frigidus AS-A4 TaxID=2933935 RepID=A0ABV0KF06_9CYAN|nr:hypothetical protein [Phormidium sp. FACHB-592]MBD2076419.1 hypothetical protein [Phormidium sp. FACHB-592]
MQHDRIDIELEAMKAVLLGKNKPGEAPLPSYVSAAIQSLQKIASELEVLERELRERCTVSKTKAAQADKGLRLALANEDMGQIFQCSIDKKVHLRLAQALDRQLSKIETERIKLNVNLELVAQELKKYPRMGDEQSI